MFKVADKIFCISKLDIEKYRKISQNRPKFNYFRPKGMNRQGNFEKIYITSEEFEALRLKHHENLKQNDAAEKMCISQTTFSRILVRAHQKMTKALRRRESCLGFYRLPSFFENSYAFFARFVSMPYLQG